MKITSKAKDETLNSKKSDLNPLTESKFLVHSEVTGGHIENRLSDLNYSGLQRQSESNFYTNNQSNSKGDLQRENLTVKEVERLKKMLYSRIYKFFIDTVLKDFALKIDKNLSCYSVLSQLVPNLETFIYYFKAMIEESFDFANPDFDQFLVQMVPKFQAKLKSLFLAHISNFYNEEESKSSNKGLWNMLQWNDKCNFMNSDALRNEQEEKRHKMQIQRQMLSEQVKEKKSNQEEKDKYSRQMMQKLTSQFEKTVKEDPRNQVNDYLLKSSSQFDSKDYYKLLQDQNNYGKGNSIKDFDYKKDCVKLNKHMIYQLRNSSSLFGNTLN